MSEPHFKYNLVPSSATDGPTLGEALKQKRIVFEGLFAAGVPVQVFLEARHCAEDSGVPGAGDLSKVVMLQMHSGNTRDLEADDAGLRVTLPFNGQPRRVTIGWEAVCELRAEMENTLVQVRYAVQPASAAETAATQAGPN